MTGNFCRSQSDNVLYLVSTVDRSRRESSDELSMMVCLYKLLRLMNSRCSLLDRTCSLYQDMQI